MKTCTKCLSNKPLSEFSYKDKTKGSLKPHCNACHNAWTRNHYKQNKDYYLSKARKRNEQVRNALYEEMLTHLRAHPCVDCGEEDLVVLVFDHKDASTKSDNVSTLVHQGCSLATLREEILKCDVRCANCHARRTAKQFGWRRSY